ncbi:DUF4238 domain-containing protein [Bradyrhizobium sp. HKCCYLRH1065]|uniref:DUF4238 domain-containing protein n=1 Tax=unclassified Bradyrhizobium TaxID=2631580 RepID=UPI003EBB3FCF
MTDENQHWVPRLLLKKFVDTDGRVYRLDIQSNVISKPPPKHAACGPNFNEFDIEGQIVSFEDRLEKIETRAAPVLKRIIEARSLSGLSSPDRKKVADFVAAQSFRTEAFYRGLANNPSRKNFGSIFTQLWDSSFIVSAQIERRHWVLMVIDHDDVFYLGDQPVVLQRSLDPKNGSDLGFDVKGVEAFLPLSPNCALFMPCRSVSDLLIARYEAAMDLHRTVCSAVMQGHPGGSVELATAQDTIRRGGPLYQSYTAAAPLTAQPENVENLNYLQCSWAHAGVFSNRRDFTFARRVFSQTPHYKSPPATRLVYKTAFVRDIPGAAPKG